MQNMYERERKNGTPGERMQSYEKDQGWDKEDTRWKRERNRIDEKSTKEEEKRNRI